MQRDNIFASGIVWRDHSKRSEWPIFPIIWPFWLVNSSIAWTDPLDLIHAWFTFSQIYWLKIWPLSMKPANSSAVTTNLPSLVWYWNGMDITNPLLQQAMVELVLGNPCFYHLSHVLIGIIVEEGWTGTACTSKLLHGRRPDLTKSLESITDTDDQASVWWSYH